MRQRVKDSPEEFLGEEQLFVRGCAKAAHARGKAVVLPVLLIVVGQELETRKTESSAHIWDIFFQVLTNMWIPGRLPVVVKRFHCLTRSGILQYSLSTGTSNTSRLSSCCIMVGRRCLQNSKKMSS